MENFFLSLNLQIARLLQCQLLQSEKAAAADVCGSSHSAGLSDQNCSSFGVIYGEDTGSKDDESDNSNEKFSHHHHHQ